MTIRFSDSLLAWSLSARLLIIFIITAITAALLMAALFSRGLGSQWQRAIAPHLTQYVAYIKDDLGNPPDESRAQALARRLPIEIQVHAGNDMLFTTADRPIDIHSLEFFKPGPGRVGRALADADFPESGHQLSADGTAAGRSDHQRGHRPGRPHQIAINDDNRRPVLRLKQAPYVVYVEMGRPRGRGRGLDEMLLAVVTLAALLGLCYLGIRRLLAPIGRLQNTVLQISGGDLEARTHERGRDDLAQLANSVDNMADRLKQMLDAKREMLLAISHELRSPLTRMRVASELLESSRHKQRLIDNVDEMEVLIEQLVETERLQGHAALHRQHLDLNRLLSDVISSIGRQQDSSIHWQELPHRLMIRVDPGRVQLLVRNIINNAMQHGRGDESTPVRIDIRLIEEKDSACIVVTDQGPGIDPEHLKSITEPFYRTDASRSRRTGGFGLGLYLCRKIAEAHQGSLEIKSPVHDTRGTRVIIRLPLDEARD